MYEEKIIKDLNESQIIHIQHNKKSVPYQIVGTQLANKNCNFDANLFNPLVESNLEKFDALDQSGQKIEIKKYNSTDVVGKWTLYSEPFFKVGTKKQLKHNRARFEDQLLSRFKDVLPEGVEVILLADRGFADQKFFRFLEETLKFKYIIR
jgi:hypothetical protein